MKKLVMWAGGGLFAIWLWVHWDRVTDDADAAIRFTLGFLFALLILLRRKKPEKVRVRVPDWIFWVFLVAGTLGALGGIILRVNILEWASVLVLLSACGLWALPWHYRGDVLLSSVVLFWVHPLPGQIFGWMQGMMQRLSVLGSEIVLHTLNVRVWGDGIVLRTGYQNFLVPEACSGMRTSVTVFLCALGVGLLLRLKWFETLAFVVLGLLQVLVLNITRISFMVVWAPRMPPDWAEHFLHDSLGLFLMIAVVLVQFEAAVWTWWSRRRAYIREGIRRKELEPKEQASIIPHPLRQLMYVSVILVAVGLIGFGGFLVAYKSRAFHRKEMIREVAVELVDRDAVSAERAIQQIRGLFPEDRELLRLHANAMVQMGRFGEALAFLEEIRATGVTLTLQETVLMSWALSREGRLGEARALVAGLGDAETRLPGVAILKAEFAAMDGVPAEVARYVEFASASHQLLPRIRALFPYLAAHEQWAAIVAADHDVPYREFYVALISLHAHQQQNDLSGLMRVMRQTLNGWPEDPRLLGGLFEIAARRQGGEWMQHFEKNLRANLQKFNTDGLARAAEYGWRLGRADLAWLVYLQLGQVSPRDPELLAAPAQHGAIWTLMQRRALSLPSADEEQRIDLRPVLDYLRYLDPLGDIRRLIPQYAALGRELEGGGQQLYLEESLAELERREAEGPLSMRFLRLYPVVLAQLTRYEEAHKRLDQMLVDYPEMAPEITLQHAVFYDQQQRWADSYEALQTFRAVDGPENLTADLLEISALMNMNLAVGAMSRLATSRERFPGAVRLDLAESAIWDVFGFKAQALHVLRRTGAGERSAAVVELFEQTGRLEDAERMRSSMGIVRQTRVTERALWLPSADLALTPRWPEPPNAAEILGELRGLREQYAEASSSSFVQGLRGLQIAWFEGLGSEDGGRRTEDGNSHKEHREAQRGGVGNGGGEHRTSNIEHRTLNGDWEGVGRTDRERAMALYQLGMYAARQKDRGLALAALARAGELLPANAAIWRARLALAGREHPEWAEAAWAACPEDPEIFLSRLVLRMERLEGDAARAEIVAMSEAAIDPETRFAVETLVRAGSYLLAQGWREEVIPLARAVERRAESLLAAHVFVMRAAMMNRDADRALAATLRGINLAVDKVPFYRALVDLKVARREVDSDLLDALEYLKASQPEDKRWAEALGSVYFERGDLRRALAIFGSVIDEDIRGLQVRTLLLAAEAARLENRVDRAVRILEAAHTLQPDQLQILNNLVYLLAQRGETLERAQALLPRLLEIGKESFAVLDTAAVVAMRAGNHSQAEAWMKQALELLEMDAYGAHEVRLNLAELQIRQGQFEAAREALQALRQDGQRPDYVDRRAREMLRSLDVR